MSEAEARDQLQDWSERMSANRETQLAPKKLTGNDLEPLLRRLAALESRVAALERGGVACD